MEELNYQKCAEAEGNYRMCFSKITPEGRLDFCVDDIQRIEISSRNQEE